MNDTNTYRDSGNYIVSTPRQGWQCPECKRVNSPDRKTCDCSACVCVLCGDKSYFVVRVPYGSIYDDEIICVDCLDKYLGDALSEALSKL